MATSTVTITEIQDLPKPIPTRLSISTGLGKILIRFGKEQDPVSKNLITAGHAFLVFVVENYGRPLDAVLQGTIEKIEKIKEALKHLHEPWLVNGLVTLDKWALDEYAEYRRRFSGRSVEAVPHRFGQAVVGWLDTLPAILRPRAIPIRMITQNTQLPKDVRDYQRYMQYEQMIKTELELRDTLVRVQELEMTKEVLVVANTQGFEGFRQDLARQEESQQQQNIELERGVVSLQAQQQETVTLYVEANAATNASLRQVEGALDAANGRITRLEVENHYLYGQIYSCQAQLGQLRNDLEDAKSGCSLM